MMSVLRVSFDVSVDVTEFLRAHPVVHPEAIWRVGEPRALGQQHRRGGFNAEVASAQRWPELLGRTLYELGRVASMLAEARALGGQVEIDFALEVGPGSSSFAPSASFSSAELQTLSGMGLAVRVSVYPVGGDVAEPGRGGTRQPH